jgi:type IV pilus assembly protein PilE
MLNSGNRGVTLIELMVVIVIIAILAGISYPSYQGYMQRTRRSDAQIALTQTAAQLEKYYTECNAYTLEPQNSPALSPPQRRCPTQPNPGLGLASALSPERHYLLSIAAGTISGPCSGAGANIACGFTLTANPNGIGTTLRQRNDGSFQLDSAGIRRWDRNNNSSFEANENTWSPK